MTLISTYYKEESEGRTRAEVVKDAGSYRIDFYDVQGNLMQSELYPGKSIHFVESAAENWTMGIKVLHG